MKTFVTCAAIALALAGCDRRVDQVDEEASMAADTKVAPTGATPGQTDPAAAMSPPAGPTDTRCEDLTGQARIDCEAQDPAGPTAGDPVEDDEGRSGPAENGPPESAPIDGGLPR